jgi:hypothetical protein
VRRVLDGMDHHAHYLHLATARLAPVACPTCPQPAEVVDRFSLGATDGPARYLKIRCQGGHWYTLPVDRVQSYSVSPVDLAA